MSLHLPAAAAHTFEYAAKFLVIVICQYFIVNSYSIAVYGQFSLIISCLAIGVSLVGLGQDPQLQNHILKTGGKDREIIVSITILRYLVLMLMVFIGFILLFVVNIDSFIKNYFIQIIFYLTFEIFLIGYRIYFVSLMKYLQVAFISIVQLVAVTTGFVLIISPESELSDFVWIFCLGRAVAAICFLLLYYKQTSFKINFITLSDLRWIKSGLPILISGITANLYFYQDQWMLGVFSGDDELGNYSLVSNFLIYFSILAVTFMNVQWSSILMKKFSCKTGLRAAFVGLYSNAFIFSIFLFASATVLSFVYFIILFEVENLIILLALLGSYLLFSSFSALENKILTLANKPSVIMWRVFFGLAINFGLNLILLPRFGGVGAAVATLLSETLAFMAVSVIPGGKVVMVCRALWARQFVKQYRIFIRKHGFKKDGNEIV